MHAWENARRIDDSTGAGPDAVETSITHNPHTNEPEHHTNTRQTTRTIPPPSPPTHPYRTHLEDHARRLVELQLRADEDLAVADKHPRQVQVVVALARGARGGGGGRAVAGLHPQVVNDGDDGLVELLELGVGGFGVWWCQWAVGRGSAS